MFPTRKAREPYVPPVPVPGPESASTAGLKTASGATATIGLALWSLERFVFQSGVPTEVYVFVQWIVPAAGGVLVGLWQRRRSQ